MHILTGFVDVDRTGSENDITFRIGPRFSNGEVESLTVSLSIPSVGILPLPGMPPDADMRWHPASISQQDVDVDQQTDQLEIRFEAERLSAGDFEIAVLTVSLYLTIVARAQ